MKKTFWILFAITFLFALTGCGNPNKMDKSLSQVDLSSAYHIVDLGKVNGEGETITRDVILYNMFPDKVVNVISGRTTCPCLTAKINRKEIIRSTVRDFEDRFVPLQSKIFEIDYNPKIRPNKESNEINETIILRTDNEDKEYEYINITLKGTIE